MHGVDRNGVIERLKQWGFWLRSARSPKQEHVISIMDSPLAKKRAVKPVYRCEAAEDLDLIMSFHLPRDCIYVLELYYMHRAQAPSAAAALDCSIRTYTAKRYEAQNILIGVLSAINCIKMDKVQKRA
ncbi:MAG: hypothetical protein ACC707_18435 [Thiohalomonadales bacterium]